MAVAVARRYFTVVDYERMFEAGILGEDDHVELVAGEIVEMSPIGPGHATTVRTLDNLLHLSVGESAIVSIQSPIRIEPDSEPEPDVAILRRGNYREAHPTPADVLLLIEVADSSLRLDRRKKLPVYAAAGIAESWLVDLVSETIERHTEPKDGHYQQVATARRGESLASTVLPEITLAVDTVLW